ncbi:unnamed protein product, partial [Closterium sp. NIES-54]
HRTTSVGGRGGVGFGLLPPHCTPYGTPFPSLNPSVLSLTGHSSTVQQALESLVVWDSVFFHRTALCGYEVEQAYAFCPLLPFPVTVQGALESLVVWDSVFFHRIALCGYEFEQAYAFFPLLPSLMRLLATATPCKPSFPFRLPCHSVVCPSPCLSLTLHKFFSQYLPTSALNLEITLIPALLLPSTVFDAASYFFLSLLSSLVLLPFYNGLYIDINVSVQACVIVLLSSLCSPSSLSSSASPHSRSTSHVRPCGTAPLKCRFCGSSFLPLQVFSLSDVGKVSE